MTADILAPSASRGVPVLAVLVVYERSIDQVEAWPALHRMLEAPPDATTPWLGHLLVYDNSPMPHGEPPSHSRLTYRHDPGNGGTAAAYEEATRLALRLGHAWLLLLDHDTHVPETYLADMTAAFRTGAEQPEVAALLPLVQHGHGPLVSPVRVTRFGTFRPLQPGVRTRPGEHVSAIASGAILRVEALRTVMPVPGSLWLDYVDHWIFAELHRNHRTLIVTDQVLQHDLSVVSLREMSPFRLDSVLRGEAYFHRMLGTAARLIYPLRLARRLLQLSIVNPRLAFKGLKSVIAGPRVHD